MDGLESLLLIALLAALVVGLAVATLRWVVMPVTIHDYERGLRYRNGRFQGLLSAGTYWVFRPTSEIRVLDARPAWQVLEGQEVPTADGVAVKVSLACRYVIGDAVAAHTGDQDFRRALHLALQLGLRDAIATRTLDETLAARGGIGAEIAERSAIELARIGVELLAVQVRDIVVPAELKRAFAAVIGARKEAEAGLERARGETAALRHLANAGRLVEQSPGLLSLRAVQQLGQSSGNSLIVTLPGGGGTDDTPGVEPADAPRTAAVTRSRRCQEPGGPVG